MLSGKQVRVRVVKTKLVPLFIEAEDRHWQEVADRLLAIFRALPGSSREAMEEEIRETVGDQPTQLIEQGLAKLLEDRCEFEVQSDVAPDVVREVVFRLGGAHRLLHDTLDRDAVLAEAATELALTAEQVEKSMFADLRDAQNILSFQDISGEHLLHRYNVSLVQALLMRATGVVVQIYGETPARYRQIFRKLKFFRLIADLEKIGEDAWTLKIDGPLSLFSSTQKYGFQLACFFPQIVLCARFEMTARVRWGTQKVEKIVAINDGHGLKTNAADSAGWSPKELEMFADSFRAKVADWTLSDDPAIVPLETGFWVPDFVMTHKKDGRQVYLEIPGFWRRKNLGELIARLEASIPGQYVLAISEHTSVDESASADELMGVYRYKRTPLPDEVVARAEAGGVRTG